LLARHKSGTQHSTPPGRTPRLGHCATYPPAQVRAVLGAVNIQFRLIPLLHCQPPSATNLRSVSLLLGDLPFGHASQWPAATLGTSARKFPDGQKNAGKNGQERGQENSHNRSDFSWRGRRKQARNIHRSGSLAPAPSSQLGILAPVTATALASCTVRGNNPV
jgi:hypothetical protein